jgi:hypothetical protein
MWLGSFEPWMTGLTGIGAFGTFAVDFIFNFGRASFDCQQAV